MESDKKWYALCVYARQEKAAAEELKTLGYDSYLPLISIRRCWSDRIKEVRVALFPGYLFVNMYLDAQARVRMLRLRQVIDLVGRQKDERLLTVRNIPESQIVSLKTMVESKQNLEPIQHLVKGTEVKVLRGPFKGAVGIVEKEPSGLRRIVVQIPLLGRGVRAELSADDLLSREELGGYSLVA